MRRHWQKRPLCIRSAFVDFKSPVSIETVFELAISGQAQARLVRQKAGRWSVSHGPHDRLPSLRTRDWTLLVNGVDRHLDEVHALLHAFRFLPDARIDDLMISVASHGGGVGPHLDSYDVFLLQAQGQRRWRIAPPGQWARVPDAPLKLIADFKPTEEWVLDPGDMLYLPPGWAHEGTAQGTCMTFSIGARAPSRREFISALLADLAEDPRGADPRFRDPGRQPARHPGQLPTELVDTLQRWACDWRPPQQSVREFVGRWLTEPAADVWFETPERTISTPQFIRLAQRHGIRLDRGTRMAWRTRETFINGERVKSLRSDQAILRTLADVRGLSAADLGRIGATSLLWPTLAHWYGLGWLHLSG